MTTDQARKSQRSNLTPEQQARVEAIRAEHRNPEARAEEKRTRDALDREFRDGHHQDDWRRYDDGRPGRLPSFRHVAAPRT